MKLLVATVFAFLTVSAFAEEENRKIDWEKVVPRSQVPGFWDGRDIKPVVTVNPRRIGRVVGGAIVVPHTHPYQAALLHQFASWIGICGGTLLSTRAVLTAAHCAVNTLSTQVILGAHQITTVEANQQRFTVLSSEYRLHAEFNGNNFNNDIAILILPSAATLNAFVTLVRLPAGDELTQLFDGQVGTISGWGRYTDASSATSPQLRSVTNQVISNAQCASIFGNGIVIPGVICLSGAGGRGGCNSDSGGPLT